MITRRWGVGFSVLVGMTACAFACNRHGGAGPAPIASGDAGSRNTDPATCTLSGRWAAQITLPVGWAQGGWVAAGSGVLAEVWLIDRTEPSLNQLSDAITLCSLESPDFYALDDGPFTGEKWGFQPVRAPDGMTFRAAGVLTRASAGATVVFDPLGIVLGAALAQPGDTWSPAPGPAASDVDRDGLPGMTLALRGSGNQEPPPQETPFPSSGLLNYRRVDRVYAALRTAFSLHGSLSGSCETMSGAADVPLSPAGVPELDRRIYGCIYQGHQSSDAPGEGVCTPDETSFIDGNVPVWTPHASGTFVEQRVGAAATCDDALAAFKP